MIKRAKSIHMINLILNDESLQSIKGDLIKEITNSPEMKQYYEDKLSKKFKFKLKIRRKRRKLKKIIQVRKGNKVTTHHMHIQYLIISS